jgi:hypothetical protein
MPLRPWKTDGIALRACGDELVVVLPQQHL